MTQTYISILFVSASVLFVDVFLASIFNESQYIALFVVSGSIKKLSSIDCVNIFWYVLFVIAFINVFIKVTWNVTLAQLFRYFFLFFLLSFIGLVFITIWYFVNIILRHHNYNQLYVQIYQEIKTELAYKYILLLLFWSQLNWGFQK